MSNEVEGNVELRGEAQVSGPLGAVAPINLVFPYAGRKVTVNNLMGAGPPPRYVGLGTGVAAGTANLADTDVSAPAPEGRVLGALSSRTVTNAGDTVRCTGTFVASSARDLTEVALFDSQNGPNIWAKAAFPAPIHLEAGQALQVTFDVTH